MIFHIAQQCALVAVRLIARMTPPRAAPPEVPAAATGLSRLQRAVAATAAGSSAPARCEEAAARRSVRVRGVRAHEFHWLRCAQHIIHRRQIDILLADAHCRGGACLQRGPVRPALPMPLKESRANLFRPGETDSSGLCSIAVLMPGSIQIAGPSGCAPALRPHWGPPADISRCHLMMPTRL